VDRKGHKSQCSLGEHDHISKEERETMEDAPWCAIGRAVPLPTRPGAEHRMGNTLLASGCYTASCVEPLSPRSVLWEKIRI